MCTGWLFLFSVLMAAGLLFTMVFFVRTLVYPCSDRYADENCAHASSPLALPLVAPRVYLPRKLHGLYRLDTFLHQCAALPVAMRVDHHVLRPRMRLYQPHRPLQQAQPGPSLHGIRTRTGADLDIY